MFLERVTTIAESLFKLLATASCLFNSVFHGRTGSVAARNRIKLRTLLAARTVSATLEHVLTTLLRVATVQFIEITLAASFQRLPDVPTTEPFLHTPATRPTTLLQRFASHDLFHKPTNLRKAPFLAAVLRTRTYPLTKPLQPATTLTLVSVAQLAHTTPIQLRAHRHTNLLTALTPSRKATPGLIDHFLQIPRFPKPIERQRAYNENQEKLSEVVAN